jgi:uncharacterized protein (TIGR03435 family)
MNGMRILITAFLAIAVGGAQQFEAASVKVHAVSGIPGTNERSGIDEGKGTIRVENLPLRGLIQAAYGVREYQFSGPDWLAGIRYDIVAKPPEGYTHAQFQPLMQALLAERFHLAVHRESKQVAGYALVVAKGTTKMHEATAPRSYFTSRPGLISCTSATVKELVGALAGRLGRPVVDRTELMGAYDIKLEWAPDGDATTADTLPSLFTALRDQLGLRLETEKVAVEVVVVDRVEKAAEN